MKTILTAIVGITLSVPAVSVAAEKGDGLRSLAEAMQKAPNDMAALRKYVNTGLAKIRLVADKDKKAAEKLIATMLEDLKAVKPTDAAAKRLHQSAVRFVPNYLTTLKRIAAARKRMAAARKEREKKQQALVGKNAFPLDAEMWVNGTPLTEESLKGKVVLVDFWAIWCGPCIRTFPHLREWQEKWGDKGLVIIGATRFYGYKRWDAEKNLAIRKRGVESKPEEEKTVLEKFAEHHKLKHRFMVAPKGSKFAAKYYATAIPTAVVIDQKGVIRLIKTGASPANAKAIEAMIEKLLDQKTTSVK